MFYEVIPTRIFRQNSGVLTYSYDPTKLSIDNSKNLTKTPPPQELQPGQIIRIPLGRTTVNGIVWRQVPRPDFPTKPISKIITSRPLPMHLLKSIKWLSEYYLTPMPVVASLILPSGIEKVVTQLQNGPLRDVHCIGCHKANADASISESSTVEPKDGITSDDPQLRRGPSDEPRNDRKEPRRESLLSRISDTAESSAYGREERPEVIPFEARPTKPLTKPQRQALQAIKSTPTFTTLLHGITGSGKTNIYLHLAREQFNNNKSTILLVPEIALTTQLVQIFTATFPDSVIVLHSKLTDTERRLAWAQILHSTVPEQKPNKTLNNPEKTTRTKTEQNSTPSPIGTSPKPLIIIGPRSALFAPVHNLGLIIIDEAHESAYFQENPPKYSALRLASFIASQIKPQQSQTQSPTKIQAPATIQAKSPANSTTCLLGTATPLATDYYLARQKHSLVPLTQKALKTKSPDIKVINLKDRPSFTKNRYFSDLLLSKITRNLENHHQTLIFHNRRGSAPLTICENCGWQALCPTCFLPLTLHSDTYELICHTCGFRQKVPTSCPDCHHSGIIHKGFGTQLLENELSKLFKNARIARFDGDNNKSNSLDRLYDEVKNGDFDIIIGTQSIARGLDLPNLATVGVVQADSGLSLPDYVAEERTFHLLTQVIGRVGRGHLDIAEAIIQTYQPDHPIITAAVSADYDKFINYLLKKRRTSFLPPYSYLAKISVTYKTEQTTLKHVQNIYKILQNFSKTSQNSTPKLQKTPKTAPNTPKVAPNTPSLIISPPTPAFHERTRRGYTWQITLRSRKRRIILDAIHQLPPNSNFHFTLDPPSLL